MDENPLLATLISSIRRGRNLEQQATADLSATQRSAHGAVMQLSAKDRVAHISAWKGTVRQRLAASRRGEPVYVIEDFDTYNADIFNTYKGYTWDEVEVFADAASDAYITELRQYSRAELTTPGLFPWLGQNTVATRSATTCVWHALSHVSEFYTERGEDETATGLLYEAMNLLVSVDATPRWQAVSRYNVACTFALQGYKQDALALLQQAYQLDASLKETAQQDTDFDSLRDNADFQALFDSQK